MMKKLFVLIGLLLLLTTAFAQERTVQVLIPETTNLAAGESAWLPGMVQDKLKSNLQDYLGMNILIDSSIEKQIKKVQQESEDTSRDEASAIELGKISTAKFSLFSKILKSNSGYSLSVNYVDNTFGAQIATALSKMYLKSDSLYGSTGAVDEITVALADKLNIQLSDLQKKKLSQSSEGFTLDEELAISKQNDEQYKKMMKEYDEDLAKLMQSNDLSAIENKKRIEADKALLVEKQNSEKKRLQELEEQKKRNEQDAKLEAERSIALKTQRDKMAKDAADKAAEVRKLKLEKQGVLGQINVLEAKKKALVEIRQGVEERCKELHTQMLADKEEVREESFFEPWRSIELLNGKSPTKAAKQGRANRIKERDEELILNFYKNCESVKNATMVQQNALLKEILSDQKNLSVQKTVNSLGGELQVIFGTYNSKYYGWEAYLSLYSDGILLYSDNFILSYETIVGKPAPKLENASVKELDEYEANMDMYNSLLVRGVPLVYFEITYNVESVQEINPSEYNFNYIEIKAINTVSGKTVQKTSLNKKQNRKCYPQWDLRETKGVVEIEKETKRSSIYDYDILIKERIHTMAESIINQKDKEIVDFILPADVDLDDSSYFSEKISIRDIYMAVFHEKYPNYEEIYDFPDYNFLEDKKIRINLSFSKQSEKKYVNQGVFSIEDNDKADIYSLFSIESISIPDCVTKIERRSLSHLNDSLKEIAIPASVKRIEEKAFKDFYFLEKVTIAASIVDEAAFYNCTSLRDIKFEDSVTEIRRDAFKYCKSLKQIVFSENIKEILIEGDILEYCKNIKQIKMPKELYDFMISCKEKTVEVDRGDGTFTVANPTWDFVERYNREIVVY